MTTLLSIAIALVLARPGATIALIMKARRVIFTGMVLPPLVSLRT
jgi:hypothetical protein